MKKYSITVKSQFKALWSILFMGFVFIIFLLYIYEPSIEFYFYFKFTILLYLIFLFPVLFLHFQYLSFNKHTYLEIADDGQSISIIENRNVQVIKVAEIEKIEFYLTRALIRKSISRSSPFENYHYCKIILKNRKSYILTCLLAENLEVILKDINVLKVMISGFYNSIR
jgi:hypothetical protein